MCDVSCITVTGMVCVRCIPVLLSQVWSVCEMYTCITVTGMVCV